MKALVLSGGGSKGAYQLGVLTKLLGVDQTVYDILCGTSVGAINCACLAQVPKGMPVAAVNKLRTLWESVSTEKVYKRWFPFGRLHALWKTSVYNSNPVQDWIRGGLDPVAIKGSGNQLRIVSVSLGTGEIFVANEQTPDLPEWVIASSAFPVMLTPASMNGDLWSDGGLRNVTPLGEAIRAGATEIDVIMCSNPFYSGPFDVKGAHAIPQVLLRAIDIMSDEVSRADLQIAGLKNDLSELRPQFKNVKIRLFQPQGPLGDSLDFSQSNVNQMYQLGMKWADTFEQI